MEKIDREKIVLVVAETQYSLRNNGAELDFADSDTKAKEMLMAEQTCDALISDKLVKAE